MQLKVTAARVMAMESHGQRFLLSKVAFSNENTRGFPQPTWAKKKRASSLVAARA
jgi:hypothetical protein